MTTFFQPLQKSVEISLLREAQKLKASSPLRLTALFNFLFHRCTSEMCALLRTAFALDLLCYA